MKELDTLSIYLESESATSRYVSSRKVETSVICGGRGGILGAGSFNITELKTETKLVLVMVVSYG